MFALQYLISSGAVNYKPGSRLILPGCAGADEDREPCAERRRMRIWLLSWLAALCCATYGEGGGVVVWCGLGKVGLLNNTFDEFQW